MNYINDAVTPTVLHGARWPPRRESWQRGSAIKQRAGRRNQRKAEYSPMPFLPKHCPRTELGRGWGQGLDVQGYKFKPSSTILTACTSAGTCPTSVMVSAVVKRDKLQCEQFHSFAGQLLLSSLVDLTPFGGLGDPTVNQTEPQLPRKLYYT